MSEQEKFARALCQLMTNDRWEKLTAGGKAYWFGQAHKLLNLVAATT